MTLTKDNEGVYDFGVVDFHAVNYDPWSMNFFAAWGHEIIAARPIPEDDEIHLTADYPASVRKRDLTSNLSLMVDCVAVGSALVAHLSYSWQEEVVDRTDVFDRYKALVVDTFGNDLLTYFPGPDC